MIDEWSENRGRACTDMIERMRKKRGYIPRLAAESRRRRRVQGLPCDIIPFIFYHGSFTAIQKPDLSLARNTTDFGKGFYTTTIRSQAEKWAERYKRRQGTGIVSVYEADEEAMRNNVTIREFATYSVEWLDFIIKCRQEQPAGDIDVVIGGIANDNVFNTLSLFSGALSTKARQLNACVTKSRIFNTVLKPSLS